MSEPQESIADKSTIAFFKIKWLKWAILVIAFSFSVLWFFSNKVPVVYVSRAQDKTARDIVLGIAEISDFHTLTLKFERGGLINEDYVEVGKIVTKGELLMQLDTEELELRKELLTIEQSFQQEETKLPTNDDFNLQKAEDEFQIQKEIWEKGRLPDETLENIARNVELLKDNRERMLLRKKLDIKVRDNELSKVQHSINLMNLYSPIDGTIVEVMARKGDLVRQSQPVVKVIDKRRLIVGTIGEEDYEKTKVGHPLELRLKAFPDTVFHGRVDQILPMSDPMTNKFEIYIKADIAEEKLLPGLTGEITIIADTHENAVVVPSQAVFDGYVLKVVGNKVQKQQVEVGFVSLLEIEILKGVEAGDILITESNNLIEEGTYVRTEWE